MWLDRSSNGLLVAAVCLSFLVIARALLLERVWDEGLTVLSSVTTLFIAALVDEARSAWQHR